MGQSQPLFQSCFIQTILVASIILTQVVGVEGEDNDLSTSTTGQLAAELARGEAQPNVSSCILETKMVSKLRICLWGDVGAHFRVLLLNVMASSMRKGIACLQPPCWTCLDSAASILQAEHS